MQAFVATEVAAPDQTCLDHGEGWLTFLWPDRMFGYECLTIELDGRCSRRMPIRSGFGLTSVELQRDRILLSFERSLAEKLALEDCVEIAFHISDADFERLQQTVSRYFA